MYLGEELELIKLRHQVRELNQRPGGICPRQAKSKGSPVLGSLGPNMSLDKELLEKGEKE